MDFLSFFWNFEIFKTHDILDNIFILLNKIFLNRIFVLKCEKITEYVMGDNGMSIWNFLNEPQFA